MTTVLNGKPNSTPAPQTAVDYQAAALKVAMEQESKSQTSTPPAKTESDSTESKSGTDDVGATDANPKDGASDSTEEKKAEGEKMPESLKASFEKLTSERAALRKEREAFLAEKKALEEKANASGKFAEAKSPMELLRAAGFTWKDAVAEVTGIRPDGDDEHDPVNQRRHSRKTEEEPKKLTLADIDPDAARDLAEFRKQREEQSRKAGRELVHNKLKEFATKNEEKFQFVSKLGEFDAALDFINSYYMEHKQLPGVTPEETMEVALAHVESNLRKQAERFRSLTMPAESADVQGDERAASRPASDDGAFSKTLSNNSGGRTTQNSKQPSTPEEYRAAALAEALRLEKQRR